MHHFNPGSGIGPHGSEQTEHLPLSLENESSQPHLHHSQHPTLGRDVLLVGDRRTPPPPGYYKAIYQSTSWLEIKSIFFSHWKAFKGLLLATHFVSSGFFSSKLAVSTLSSSLVPILIKGTPFMDILIF